MVNGPEEARGFMVLLEEVRSDMRMLTEGIVTLEQKVDRGFKDVRREMATGFGDVRTDMTALAKALQNHTHPT